MSIVYGFDVGTGSLAAIIRNGSEIVWKKSLILDADFASTAPATARRRMARTRQAHRAREFWWNQCCEQLGIKPLKTMIRTASGDFRVVSVDDRLKREFPAKSDDTLYTSCLLRVKILTEGVNGLQDWQIYKAIHAAIQKRGYDPKVPWASAEQNKKTNTKKDTKDQEDEDSRISEFVNLLANLGLGAAHQLPCYFEAYQMGLWSPESGIKGIRQNHLAKSAETAVDKGYTPPREHVEAELKALLQAVKVAHPSLDIDYVLYGPHRKAYASHGVPALRPGSERDWQGVLSQKIPRFSNRALAKCLLIPRFHVCKKDDPIYREFHLGWQLHNLRIFDSGQLMNRPLSIAEFKALFLTFREKGSATPKQLESALGKLGLKFMGDSYALEAPAGGRSSLSRPALRILNEMLQNGHSPKSMYEIVLSRPRSEGSDVPISANDQPTKGLIVTDLDWLKSLGDAEWDRFWLPQARFDAKYSMKNRDAAISSTIAEVNNPVVRHRLNLFVKTLDEMTEFIRKKFNVEAPDFVAVELVREDFMGEKAKREFNKAMKRRKEINIAARNTAEELGVVGVDAVRKVKLWQRQGEKCLYTGRPISQAQINACEVDHIVPQADGGPDADYNLALTFGDTNRDKGSRTPWQWFGDDSTRWGQFIDQVRGTPTLKGKVVKVLTSATAKDLVERYQDLAETAWMAKLLTTITQLKYDWKPSHFGNEKRVHHVNGALTALMRRKYDLNSIMSLANEGDTGKVEVKKNRKDDRHHLLDAMVISFISTWARDPKLKEKMALPNGVTKETFAEHLRQHRPIKIPARPLIEENFYGFKEKQLGQFRSKRESIHDLGIKSINMKPIFSLDSLRKKVLALRESPVDPQIVRVLEEALTRVETASDPSEEWKRESAGIRHPSGSTMKKVQIYGDLVEEVKILSGNAMTGKQIIKPKGNHRGFYIVKELGKKGPTYRALPVYAWESLHQGRERQTSVEREVLWFIRSGDYVQTDVGISDVPAGTYQLNSIMNGIQVILRPLESTEVIRKSINSLMSEAKLRRLPESAEYDS